MELIKINNQNVWAITKLEVSKDQEKFVASNVDSIIEAFATRESGYVALPFGLYEGGVPVGFVMIGYGSSGDDEEPEIVKDSYCIWRFMIDKKYQGRGLGNKAMRSVMEYIRTFPCGKARYGRETAINTSDIDILVELPKSEYDRYDIVKGNGQSRLLQAVRSAIQTAYYWVLRLHLN